MSGSSSAQGSRRTCEGRKARSGELADLLIQRILEGTYAPGDRLPAEREFSTQLGVNRSSLREALKKLEQLHLIEIQQGSGARVLSYENASMDLVGSLLLRGGRPDMAMVRDVCEMRDTFYVNVLRLALQRAKPDDLRALVKHARWLARPDVSIDDRVVGHFELQRMITRMTGNQVLVLCGATIVRIQEQLLFDAAAVDGTYDRRPFTRALKLLAHAIEARDMGTAMRAFAELLRRGTERVLRRAAELAETSPDDGDGAG